MHNEGNIDRVVRGIVAVVAAIVAIAVGAGTVGGIVLWVVAAIMAVTAILGDVPDLPAARHQHANGPPALGRTEEASSRPSVSLTLVWSSGGPAKLQALVGLALVRCSSSSESSGRTPLPLRAVIP